MTTEETDLDLKQQVARLREQLSKLRREHEDLQVTYQHVATKGLTLNWDNIPEDNAVLLKDFVPIIDTEARDEVVTQNDLLAAAATHKLVKGDNLHALIALLPEYKGTVDFIYIDPPYNTGNSFIYNDKFVAKDDRFKHSSWLSFMSRRLELAWQFLKPTGIIMVAIDDKEQAYLKVLMDRMYGEENFVANLIWKSKSGGANDGGVAVDHEYILVYRRSEQAVIALDTGATVSTSYSNEDEHGRYALERLDKQNLGYQPSLDFPIKGPDGDVYRVEQKDSARPSARWRWSKSTVEERYDELVFKDGNVYTKNYEKEAHLARTVMVDDRFGRTRTGGTQLRKVVNDVTFEYPKNTRLLSYLIKLAAPDAGLVMDFFAGSGTTGHAVAELNAEDGGSRRALLVTDAGKSLDDPDAVDIADEVTWKRLTRVLTGEDWADGKEHPNLAQNAVLHDVRLVPATTHIVTDYDADGEPLIATDAEGNEERTRVTDYDLAARLVTEGHMTEERARAAIEAWKRWRD